MATTDEQEPDLAEAQRELQEATERYRQAKEQADHASREATACLNSLNTAQQTVDSLIEVLHQRAPRDSDWWVLRHRRTDRD